MAATHFAKRTMMILVSALAMSAPAKADPPAPTTTVVTTPNANDQCVNWSNTILADFKQINQTCKDSNGSSGSSCLANALKCDAAEKKLGGVLQTTDTDQNACENIAELGCPEAGGSSQDEQTTLDNARRDATEAQKARDDINQQNTKSTSDMQQQQNQLAKQATDENNNYMQQSMQAGQQIQKDLMEGQSQQAQQVMELQKKFDELNQKYVGLSDDMRSKQSAVNNLVLQLNVACRGSATEAAKAAQVIMDKEIDDEKKEMINAAASTASGRNNRLRKRKRAKIVDAYSSMYQRCMAGADGKGAELVPALAAAKSAVSDTAQHNNQQLQILQSEKTEYLSDIAQQSNLLQQKEALAVQSYQQNQMMQSYTHQQNQAMLAQQMMQQQGQAVQQQQITTQQAQDANNRANAANNDQLRAAARLVCGANMSTDDVSQARKDRSSTEAAIKEMASYCQTYQTSCETELNPQSQNKYMPLDNVCNTPAVKDAAKSATPVDPNSGSTAKTLASPPTKSEGNLDNTAPTTPPLARPTNPTTPNPAPASDVNLAAPQDWVGKTLAPVSQ